MDGSALILARTQTQCKRLCTLVQQALPALVPVAHATAALPCLPDNVRLLLVDVDGLPLMQRTRLLDSLQQHMLANRTLLFSRQLEEALLQRVLTTGMAGYLLTSQPEAELCDLLTHLAATPPLFAPAVWQHLLMHFRSAAPAPPLTQRERDVLAAIGDGLTVARAASRLALSQNTVASYVKQIYRKLGIRNRAEAAQVALQLGLLKPAQRP